MSEEEIKTVERCIEVISETVEYNHAMPCPDGKPGCLVSHTVAWSRPKSLHEMRRDLRALAKEMKE